MFITFPSSAISVRFPHPMRASRFPYKLPASHVSFSNPRAKNKKRHNRTETAGDGFDDPITFGYFRNAQVLIVLHRRNIPQLERGSSPFRMVFCGGVMEVDQLSTLCRSGPQIQPDRQDIRYSRF